MRSIDRLVVVLSGLRIRTLRRTCALAMLYCSGRVSRRYRVSWNSCKLDSVAVPDLSCKALLGIYKYPMNKAEKLNYLLVVRHADHPGPAEEGCLLF